MGHQLFFSFCDETPSLKQLTEERIYLDSQFQKYMSSSWQRILASMSLHGVKMPKRYSFKPPQVGKDKVM